MCEQGGGAVSYTHLDVYKRQHTALPNKPKKAWKTLSARKVLTTVFWDVKGILLLEFMECGATINSEVYCEALKN